MTLIIENGSGVFGANSFVDPTYVTAYLTDRNRETENSWDGVTPGAEEEAACVAAADYIETRFRQGFKGTKEFRDISLARATFTLTANPLTTETVTLGSQVYTFLATIVSPYDVLIGANAAESIANLIGAINADANFEGTAFLAGTDANPDASVNAFYDNQLVAFSKTAGTAGNTIISTTTVTGASWNFATLVGGGDVQIPQPLSFPRTGLYDHDGIPIIGMPQNLLYAAAEYAVRARAAVLAPDPTADPFGGNVVGLREKVGPIETATQYQPGTANSGTLPSYPAVDRLLSDFVRRGGVVIR